MKRGDLVIVADRQLGRPRPAVVVQADEINSLSTVLICSTTTTERDAPAFRVPVTQLGPAGLIEPSWIMVERMTFVRTERCERRIGRLSPIDQDNLDRSLALMIGLKPEL